MQGRRLIFGALVVLAGCDADPDAGLVADPRAGTPPTIEAEAVLSVGVVAGDTLQEFDRVVTPFVLADGRLVVPLGGSSEIRVFSPEGTFARRLGGSGEGPGEFRYLSAAWPRGDTIEAFDSRLRRVNRYLPDGSLEVVAIPGGEYPDMSVAVGPLGEGWVLGGVVAGGTASATRFWFITLTGTAPTSVNSARSRGFFATPLRVEAARILCRHARCSPRMGPGSIWETPRCRPSAVFALGERTTRSHGNRLHRSRVKPPSSR